MAQCEYAWTSFRDNAKIFKYTSQRTKDEIHFHPTEKPVSLYAWIYQKYAKPGDKILDTHHTTDLAHTLHYDAEPDEETLEAKFERYGDYWVERG